MARIAHTDHFATARAASRTAAALLALSVACLWSTDSHAESSLQTGAGALRAAAHLDFRVTILPSMGLTMDGRQVRIAANSGSITVQHDQASSWDGRSPTSSSMLQHDRQLVDKALLLAQSELPSLITIAAP